MDLQLAAFGVGGGRKGCEGVLGHLVVGMLCVIGPDTSNFARGNIGRNTVDVPVGLIGINAVLYPNDLLAAKIIAQVLFDLALGIVRVTTGREQAHLGSDDRSFPVNGERASLEDEVVGLVAVDVSQVAHLHSDEFVLVPGEVEAVVQAAPGIESEMNRAQVSGVVDNEGGPAVADPRIVGFHLHDIDKLVVLKKAMGSCVVDGLDSDCHGFEVGNGARHVGENLLCGFCPVLPVVGSMRPKHPDALLGLVLAGHMEPVCFGR